MIIVSKSHRNIRLLPTKTKNLPSLAWLAVWVFNMYLLTQDDQIRWNKDLPIKVIIHSWRLRFDRLPTRFNLDMRGIDLHSTRSPVCQFVMGQLKQLIIYLLSVKSILIFGIRLWFGGSKSLPDRFANSHVLGWYRKW